MSIEYDMKQSIPEMMEQTAKSTNSLHYFSYSFLYTLKIEPYFLDNRNILKITHDLSFTHSTI